MDVMVYFYQGSASGFIDSSAVETTVAGHPAFSKTDATTNPPSGVVAVELGESVVVLIFSTSDSAVDLIAAASQLAPIAVPRVAEAAPSEPEPDTEPAASTHPDPCSLFSADELSELLGTTVSAFADVELGSCSWDSAESGSSVSVTFDAGGLKTMETVIPTASRSPWLASRPIRLM